RAHGCMTKESRQKFTVQIFPFLLVKMLALMEPPQKMGGNNLFGLVSQCFEPAAACQRFQSSVPTDDPPFHILDHDSYIDGLDNIFAEILQAFIFRGLL